MRRRHLLAATAALITQRLGKAGADDPETVTVGGIQLPTNAPLFIGIEQGLFAKQGIKVNLTWFSAAASVFSAVVSRDVDIAATATTAATYNLAAKGGFRIVGGTTRDAPHFPLNAVLASNKAWDGGFTSLPAMGGKRWAMTTAGSTHHYDIGMMARKYGVPMTDIQLVPLESYGNIIAALQSGQVDGAILPPSLAGRMLDAKTAHFLAWTGDEVPMQQGVVCASPQTIARKRDTMTRFMRAYAEGTAVYHRVFNQVDAQGTPVTGGPDSAALIAVIARYANIKPAEAAAQVAFIIPDLRPDQADIRQQIAFWQEAGLVAKSADFANLFDVSLLPGSPS
ncbi:MAG: ABC transporter substrate-binding protein [Acetobacteraceae bacterium]|nr:ABC transporter substrate-binding protein [Acetobacteraceae bacterium]